MDRLSVVTFNTWKCDGDYDARPEPSCVDYIFLIQRAADPALAVIEGERVLDRADPASGLYPSDHFGVSMRIGEAPRA